jgi:hypothetical protein
MWTHSLPWKWSSARKVLKLLGSLFGLTLISADVNEFSSAKIKKKLLYWLSIHLNAAGREIITNSVLISSLL